MLKKEETKVGSWKPATIPGSSRPLASHYGQTRLQHFPKEPGSRQGGEDTGSVCASVPCMHVLRVHLRRGLTKSRGEKQRKKGKHARYLQKGNREITAEGSNPCEGLCRCVLNSWSSLKWGASVPSGSTSWGSPSALCVPHWCL